MKAVQRSEGDGKFRPWRAGQRSAARSQTSFTTPFMKDTAASPAPGNLDVLRLEVAALIVEALNLDLEPASIPPDDSLFGEGLGLDSIDILEVALVVSKRYGFQLRADNEDNVRIFSSLRSLTEYIAANRTQ